ncbi:MAG: OsmC family protein, partial [Saprospiraceae bacterium]|nr:OsmC family protein [Saprospiraceae bacterium]
PVHLGGKDLGPDPYTLLLSALASCTLSTLRMYIDRKAWQIGTINIEVNLSQAIVEGKIVSTFYRNIIFGDPITEDQNERLLSIARKCPVSKILENGIAIETQTKFLN